MNDCADPVVFMCGRDAVPAEGLMKVAPSDTDTSQILPKSLLFWCDATVGILGTSAARLLTPLG